MECPNCQNRMTELEEASRGMGNQAFFNCPVCGSTALCSGEKLTQYWLPTNGQEGGNECHHLAHMQTLTNV